MNRLHQTFYIISMTGITLAILTLLYAGYMLFWPVKTVTFTQTEKLEIVNENKTVKVGEDLFYKVSYCRYTDTQAKVTREIHDGVIYVLPEIQTNLTKGCFTDRVINIGTMPKAIAPGKYSMYTTIEFKVNALRTVTHTLTTEDFYVIK